jgi:anti-sigma factor RsiW
MTLNQTQDDLDWTAFCYAAGELDAAAAEQFEARLADEQPAREALARAIELTQAVSAAESQPATCVVTPAVRQRSKWTTRLSWMAVGGLASLLLAVLWSGALSPDRPQPTASRPAVAPGLADAWTQTRAEIASAKEAGDWPAFPAAASYGDEESLSPDDDLVLEETPSWMTAAVIGLAGMTPEEASPFSSERGDN